MTVDKRPGCEQLSDQLRWAIERSGVTRYQLWRQTGVDQAALSRFMAGKGGLSMESIDLLALALRLRLVADDRSITFSSMR
jgi:DNA transposition AAA+ family ATPase